MNQRCFPVKEKGMYAWHEPGMSLMKAVRRVNNLHSCLFLSSRDRQDVCFRRKKLGGKRKLDGLARDGNDANDEVGAAVCMGIGVWCARCVSCVSVRG